MRYAIDLNKVSLNESLALLKQQNLLPSRRLLLEDIDARFARIQACGVATVAQLLKALSSPAKIEAFAAHSGVPEKYLAVLRREAGTLQQKPVPLVTFPDTDEADIDALARQGIKNSKDYFESGKADGTLYTLCDLVRINGVGPNAAAMFYAAGCRSVADIADADAETLLGRITAANENQCYYAGTLGKKDMQFCIDFAKLLLRFGA